MSSLILENADILIVGEIKLDYCFSTTQFLIVGFHHPFRLEIYRQSGGLLVYVKGSIPSRVLTSFSTPADSQIVGFQRKSERGKVVICWHL